jgi:tryptophan synthase beta chain
VRVPEPIVSLMASRVGSDRELAVALWVLFATRSGDAERNVWRAYAEWLPTAEELPNLMLANDKELDQLQDEALKREAKATQNAADKLFLDGIKKNTETDGVAGDFFVIRDGLEVTAEDARWAFALVASRALASPVGDDGSSDFAAILTPFFDMANSDDVSLVSASKSVRGTADADVENAARVVIERGLNQGVGGPRVVLETTRGLESADAEILISYDPTASNAELMLRYGFSLRGNRNERLPGPSGFFREDAKTAKTRKPSFLESEILRFALEETGLMTEETSAEERRRLFVAVASACGGFGNPEEDQGEWELDDAQVRLEIACAEAFVDAWTKQLRSFDTDLAQDEAALTAAQTGSLPGATPRIVAAVEYRAERKRCLETGVRALRAYVEWLQEEEEEEESAGGFVDQQE